jgi:aminoglycoside phosphotransferase (APT) family kinase protein
VAENQSSPVWAAERTVTPESARALIESQFPDLAPVAVAPLGTGWDNTAFHVNGALVFRFPRRQLGADILQYELRVLPHLIGQLPLAVPNPEWIGAPADGYPWTFAGYRRLPGRTACAAALSEEQRASAAEPLGVFLSRLHAISIETARTWGAPPDLLGRLDPEKRIPQTRDYLRRAF